jgi:predicted molibdopterin-dependent oxidoreductase YjgC
MDMRIRTHPILDIRLEELRYINIWVDGKRMKAVEGEPIAAALLAMGIRTFRKTPMLHHPRGLFCGIGRCTDCALTVDGVSNIRACVTPVAEGMKIETQNQLVKWGAEK